MVSDVWIIVEINDIYKVNSCCIHFKYNMFAY